MSVNPCVLLALAIIARAEPRGRWWVEQAGQSQNTDMRVITIKCNSGQLAKTPQYVEPYCELAWNMSVQLRSAREG